MRISRQCVHKEYDMSALGREWLGRAALPTLTGSGGSIAEAPAPSLE